jgi:5-methylcytosine-specific restriction endonuclease McrA
MTLINCDYCGGEFNKKPSLIEKSENNFCDSDCYGSYLSENRSGNDHPQYNKKKVTCKNCGKEKEVSPSHHEKVENHYCNAECQAEYEDRSGENNHFWKGGKETVECEYCESLVEVHQYRTEEYDTFFCNVDCRGKWATEEFSGENHPLWEGYSEYYGEDWLAIRDLVRERDNGTCQICGTDSNELGQWPDVHHIKPVKDFEDPNNANYPMNLISLCSSCHGKVEQGELECPTRAQ